MANKISYYRIVVLLATVAAWSLPAHASDLCGKTIRGRVVLDHDQECKGNGITLAGGGVLRLRGFSIRGPNTGDGVGITVDGGGRIKGPGVVTGFGTGILIEDGRVFVLRTTITGNVCCADGGDGNGIEVLPAAAEPDIWKNTISDNDGVGIIVRDGEGEDLVKNTIENNGGGGIAVATRSRSIGVDIVKNRLLRNDKFGILVTGSTVSRGNQITRNKVMETDGPGILLDGCSHIPLRRNELIKNVTGLHLLEGSTFNEITRNTAIENTEIDLVDDNPDCDNNRWKRNRFGTANQDCIK